MFLLVSTFHVLFSICFEKDINLDLVHNQLVFPGIFLSLTQSFMDIRVKLNFYQTLWCGMAEGNSLDLVKPIAHHLLLPLRSRLILFDFAFSFIF